MNMIEITRASQPIIAWHWPDLLEDPGGEYLFVAGSTPDTVRLQWQASGEPPWTYESIAALAASPEWLAHRKRELIDATAEAITAPMSAAWRRWDAIRFAAPARLSVPNQSAHEADLNGLSAAIAAAEQAIGGATTVAAAESAAAAVVPPTYRGPQA